MFRHNPPHRFEMHDSFGPGAFEIVFLVALLALVVLFGVWVFTNIRRNATPTAAPVSRAPLPAPPSDTALHEARMRYARGEIARDDFVRMMEDLGGVPPEPPPVG